MTMNVISRSKTRDGFGIAFAQCGRCAMPVTAIVQMHEATVDNWVAHAGNDVLTDTKAQLIAVLPKASKPSAPDHVDKGVARVFVQAEGARKRKELDNAGMAYRKTLDIGLKKFDATLKGTLYERIDALAARHDITTSVWLTSADVSFIHPRGHERGWDQIRRNFYEATMGALFSERTLKAVAPVKTVPSERSPV
jgi:hypothetical protein